MEYNFEPMTDGDCEAVIDIWNYFIDNSFAAYPESRVGYDIFDRFLMAIGEYPAVTIRTDNDCTVGFAFIRAFHSADSFSRTAEIT